MKLKFKKVLSLGRVERFELKNNGFVLLLIGPALFVFSYFINNYGDETIKIKGARELFAFLFLVVGILPFLLKKTIYRYYGWIIFFLMFSFTHYLIINLYLNNFILRFLLGFYTFVFGAILLFNNRLFINVFMITIFFHLMQKLNLSEVSDITYSSIVSSFSILFLFSSIILNGSTQFRRKISGLNQYLEKRVQERTLDLEAKAKDLSEKNRDLEEFAYVVSHDLKTPLSNILAISNWLKEDLKDNDSNGAESNLKLLEKQIVHMDLLIKGVLDYSLQNEVTSDNALVDLNILVGELVEFNSNKNCEITIKNNLPTIRINESQILQVFQNLIQNAIKYNDKEVCKIEVDFKKEDGFYNFSVKDNGIGIDEKYHKKIFELFQRLDSDLDTDSLGLGLALISKIIKRNNGKIYLESKPQKGTTFYFTLPV